MIIKLNKARRKLLQDLFTHRLIIERKKSVVGWSYHLLRANGNVMGDLTSSRINQYSFKFLEEHSLIRNISKDPLYERYAISSFGTKVANLLKRAYSGPIQDEGPIELNVKEGEE